MSAQLRTIEPQPLGKTIISRLEWALELARKGELSSVAIAVVYRDGCGGHQYSDVPSCGLLVGTIARMQAAIIRDIDE